MTDRYDFSADVTAIVMAGGKSSRMGTDKSQLLIDNVPMIEFILKQLRPYFNKILISSNSTTLQNQIVEEIVPDEIPNKGPVMGLISTLKKSTTDLNFVQACDIPKTNMALLGELLSKSVGFDAVVPRDPTGRIEPLFAVYRKCAINAMEHVMEHEKGRASSIVEHCQTRFIELRDSTSLGNLNTIADYKAFIKE